MHDIHKTAAAESVPAMREIIASGKGFWLTVTGRSMAPFLKPKDDRVYIAPMRGGKYRRGDVLFIFSDSKPILHRVCRTGEKQFWLCGDAHNYVEGPFGDDCIIGVMTDVIGKKGRHTHINKFMRFLGCAWLLTRPFRPTLHSLSASTVNRRD
ncbi:MAG TPA: S24/S26 family peptidase [Bacillota bacterium]|nr:S24/S26 family peptidase [Bacillota bacterium]